ncbi:MAG: recombinase family protein [Clostridia bacterium]|nr:recombinase family protein [Clostridia bacterium]
MNPIKNKIIAAYCRVSTDKSDQTNSFLAQQSFFKKYIASNPNWELYEIFADEGITGTSTKKRSAFNRMIECAVHGDFDMIITKEISRFARNTLDSIYYTRELKRHGVGVIFLNDGINTLDGDAELRLSIMASLAQEESRRTSQRVKWGQRQRMAEGVVFGRSMLGYDVENGKITVNEQGAEIVRLIFKKYVEEGKGATTIARELNEEGIKPLQSEQWSHTAILRILKNEKYCGDLVQQKTFTPDYLTHDKKTNTGEVDFVKIKDHHQPIIHRQIFEKANKILSEKNNKKSKEKSHSNRYVFSSKIVCGKCGSTYSLRQKKKDGIVIYKAWVCTEAHKNGSVHFDKNGNSVGCSNNAINNDYLIEIMQYICRNLPLDKETLERHLLSVIGSLSTENSEKSRKINILKRKQLSLIELFNAGEITHEEFEHLRSKYETELQNLTSQKEIDDKTNYEKINKAVKNILNGTADEDWFYYFLLSKIVVKSKENIEVFLKNFSQKWCFEITKNKTKNY